VNGRLVNDVVERFEGNFGQRKGFKLGGGDFERRLIESIFLV